MLGPLCIRRYSPPRGGSDNASGAGNQQERPGRPMLILDQIPESVGYYFAGFVDGEGSFNLSFRRRADYKLPWKVSLCLNVSQKVTEEFKGTLGPVGNRASERKGR